MSGHTAVVMGEIATPYKWWVVCDECGPMEWSHDADEAARLAEQHMGVTLDGGS